jgi:hypothetical protein
MKARLRQDFKLLKTIIIAPLTAIFFEILLSRKVAWVEDVLSSATRVEITINRPYSPRAAFVICLYREIDIPFPILF